jgi:hypothetical protein
MSKEEDKFKHSKRLLKDENAVKKQSKIAKAHGFPTGPEHRLAKVHATTCGDSNCVMCGNPRKFFGEETVQEKRLFQDVEKSTDRHSNGILPPTEIEEDERKD